MNGAGTVQTGSSGVWRGYFVDARSGVIAYVRRSTHDIHLISPDGTGDRVLWAAPRPLGLLPAHDLAWRPDGRELAFSSEHEEACSYYESDVYAIGYNGAGYRRVTNSPACAALAILPKGSVVGSPGTTCAVRLAGDACHFARLDARDGRRL